MCKQFAAKNSSPLVWNVCVRAGDIINAYRKRFLGYAPVCSRLPAAASRKSKVTEEVISPLRSCHGADCTCTHARGGTTDGNIISLCDRHFKIEVGVLVQC